MASMRAAAHRLLLLLLLSSAAVVVWSFDDPMKVHSTEHLADHMQDLHLAGGGGGGGGSSEQQEYYYFKLHDFDNNGKLDGLELLKSLLDHGSQHQHQHGEGEGEPVRSDHQLEQTVERILKDEDTNGDGYIDYTEFVAAQRREAGMS